MQSPPEVLNEQLRLEALHALGQLDTEHEERFDRIVEVTKLLFDVPVALLTMLDAERQWFKAKVGVSDTGTERSISFCGHAIAQEDVMVVEDALADPRFNDNPMVNGPPFMRFYAGAPLEICTGLRIGTLCVIDTEPREFSAGERRLLRRMGNIIRDELVRPPAPRRSELAPRPEEFDNRQAWQARLRRMIGRQ